jgi:hypothetical protein
MQYTMYISAQCKLNFRTKKQKILITNHERPIGNSNTLFVQEGFTFEARPKI